MVNLEVELLKQFFQIQNIHMGPMSSGGDLVLKFFNFYNKGKANLFNSGQKFLEIALIHGTYW